MSRGTACKSRNSSDLLSRLEVLEGRLIRYIHIHTYIHKYIHTYVHTYIRTYMHAPKPLFRGLLDNCLQDAVRLEAGRSLFAAVGFEMDARFPSSPLILMRVPFFQYSVWIGEPIRDKCKRVIRENLGYFWHCCLPNPKPLNAAVDFQLVAIRHCSIGGRGAIIAA